MAISIIVFILLMVACLVNMEVMVFLFLGAGLSYVIGEEIKSYFNQKSVDSFEN